MHLVDHARVHIERTYARPPIDRLLRALLARVLPDNRRLRLALAAARLGKPFAGPLAALGLEPLAAMLRLAPARLPAKFAGEGQRLFAPIGPRRGRVALLTGCVGPVLNPSINAAAIRLLTRHGVEVVVADAGCCGSLVHHMGREHAALAAARRQVDAWTAEIAGEGLDAILVTASGCGTTVKDYGFVLRTDAAYADKAARVSRLALDISEYLSRLELSSERGMTGLTVAYHSACSLQHGQKIARAPKELLSKIGFVVKDVPEGHLCCGSAGTYNILQPELARRLRERKVENIEKLKPHVIAAGNIGCMTQIAAGTVIPVVHTVELIDWATGGPAPEVLAGKGVSSAKGATVAVGM
jgi:glycolate dehydrogenase iron-sulfur subunit